MSLNRSLIHGFLIAVSFSSYLHASRTDDHATKPAMTDTQSISLAKTFEERLKAGIEDKRRREEKERAAEKEKFERRDSVRSFRTLQDSYNFTEQPQKEGDSSKIILKLLHKELNKTRRICSFAWLKLPQTKVRSDFFDTEGRIKIGSRFFEPCKRESREDLRSSSARDMPEILQIIREFNKKLVLLLADNALDVREDGIQVDERGISVPEE